MKNPGGIGTVAVVVMAACVDLKAPAAQDAEPAEVDAGVDAPRVDGGSSFRLVHAVPQGPTLNGIWVASPTFAVAVGQSVTTYVIRDGVVSGLGGDQPGRDYEAVSGIAEDEVYAAGQTASSTGFVDRFDGVVWTSVFDAPVPLFGVWATRSNGKTVVMACGAYGKVYGWVSGSSWEELLTLTKGPNDSDLAVGPRLWAISGRDPNDWTIAADGRVWRREDGGIYFYDADVGGTDLQFRGVWQSPERPTSVYFGTNFSGLAWFSATRTGADTPMSILYRDASIPSADKAFLYGVWGTAAKVVAVGQGGRVYLFDPGRAEGAFVAAPTDATLTSVSGSSADNVWIVGERSVILHGSAR